MDDSKNQEVTEKKGVGLSLLVDDENVTISIDRFTELVKKETELEVVRRIYLESGKYDVSDHLAFLFGPRPEVKE